MLIPNFETHHSRVAMELTKVFENILFITSVVALRYPRGLPNTLRGENENILMLPTFFIWTLGK